MKFNPEKLEPLARGSEKKIYIHPYDPEKIIAESGYDESDANATNQRFYLTKLLHTIFPKNIPDISFIGKGSDNNQQMVMERKHLDPAHNELRDLTSEFWKKIHGEGSADTDTSDAIEAREQAMAAQLKEDSNYKNFIEKTDALGLEIDSDPRNFGYDEEGNIVYIDNNFFPLNVKPETYDALHDAVQKLEGQDREHALVYWSRLEALRKEANEKR